MDPFSDPQAVAAYGDRPPRLVPGFADLQRMALLLLSEHMPDDGRLLVLGAGGGLELKVFADARPGWRFAGVEPAAEMLTLARTTLGPLADRVTFHHGYIEAAPEGPFDAASSLLTLHFVSSEERLGTLVHVRRRLKHGAPFVLAHLSFPQTRGARKRWLDRYVAFAVSSGIEPEKAEEARSMIDNELPILEPEQEERMLHDAGFSDVEMFYAGFCFRGWVARATDARQLYPRGTTGVSSLGN